MELKIYSWQNLGYIQTTSSPFQSGIEECFWQNYGGCRFYSARIVVQVLEGIANFLQPTNNDTDDTWFTMANVTSQSTLILTQLVQQMKQMQSLIAHLQTKLNSNNKNGGNDNNSSGGNKSNKVPFWRQFCCWTHCVWNHQRSHCLSKAEYHKEIAALD